MRYHWNFPCFRLSTDCAGIQVLSLFSTGCNLTVTCKLIIMSWIIHLLWCSNYLTTFTALMNFVNTLVFTGVWSCFNRNVWMLSLRCAFSPGITTYFACLFNYSFFRAGGFLYRLNVTVPYHMITFSINLCMLWCVGLSVDRNCCLILCNCGITTLLFWNLCYITISSNIISIYKVIILITFIIFKTIIFIFTTLTTSFIECGFIAIPLDYVICIIVSRIIFVWNITNR